MTKEGKVTIGILCFLILITTIYTDNNTDEENTPAKLTQAAKTAVLNKKENKNKQENTILEIKGLKIANENKEIRNPFTYSHEQRGETIPRQKKISEVLHSDDKQNLTKNLTETKKQTPTESLNSKPKAEWKLTGVIIADKNKTAILSRENESKILSVGDTFDNKTVTAIEENYISYASDKGEKRLNLTLP